MVVQAFGLKEYTQHAVMLNVYDIPSPRFIVPAKIMEATAMPPKIDSTEAFTKVCVRNGA